MANGETSEAGWMSDVQRAIALVLIGTFALATLFATICLVFLPDVIALVDMSKTLQAALVNMSLIALGFFFGNTMAKMQQDAGQQKVVEKLTSTAPPGAPGPVAPLAGPIVVAWWTLLTPAEQAAITAAGPADPRVAAFIIAAGAGKATPDDLAYLVAKNLLTPERANVLQSS